MAEPGERLEGDMRQLASRMDTLIGKVNEMGTDIALMKERSSVSGAQWSRIEDDVRTLQKDMTLAKGGGTIIGKGVGWAFGIVSAVFVILLGIFFAFIFKK